MYYEVAIIKTAKDWFSVPESGLPEVLAFFEKFNPCSLSQSLGTEAAKIALANAQEQPLELQAISMHLGRAISKMSVDAFRLGIYVFKDVLSSHQNSFTETDETTRHGDFVLFKLNSQARELIFNGITQNLTANIEDVDAKKQVLKDFIVDFDLPKKTSLKF